MPMKLLFYGQLFFFIYKVMLMNEVGKKKKK
nr:MAG TPA: hypothetical protein [Caudoviricetes sp.]